jgi:hypothetical protein
MHKVSLAALVLTGAASFAVQAQRARPIRRSPTSWSPPTRSTSMPASWPRSRARPRTCATSASRWRPTTPPSTSLGHRAGHQAEGQARGQRHQRQPEEGRRRQPGQAQEAEGQGLRQGLRRPRGHLPPGGDRRGRQDAAAVGQERRVEGPAGEGAAGAGAAPASTPSTCSRSWAASDVRPCPWPARQWPRSLAAPAGAAADAHVVTIDGMVPPATLTVRPGDKVVWRTRTWCPTRPRRKGASIPAPSRPARAGPGPPPARPQSTTSAPTIPA